MTLLKKIGEDKNQEFVYELTVRRTRFIPLFKGVFTMVLFILILLLLWQLRGLVWWSALITFAILASWLGIAILRWSLEFYRLEPEEVIHREGVLFIRKEIMLLKNVEKIKLHQDIIGKLLDYGTIHLYAPTIEQDFQLRTVGQPELFVKALEMAVHKQKSNLAIIKT